MTVPSAAGVESTPDQIAAAAACRDVVLAFHRCIDTGNATAAADLFTDDATLEVRGSTFVGRAAIDGFLGEREAADRITRHVVVEWSPTGGAASEVTATATVAILHLPPSEKDHVLERIIDADITFRRGDDDRWRMADRRSRLVSNAAALLGGTR